MGGQEIQEFTDHLIPFLLGFWMIFRKSKEGSEMRKKVGKM